ncbi:hypothetical protein F3J16_04530 [Burkholderia sp. Ap-962]|uniref:hypothetical protein n=1 Tax=Burkholderia sp. Ap-962 TaxID=2608333 RepID=UPI00142098D9|nr:hypothetical protein [Burkholderia sp. Ap-962]NIF69463.1 hypothetical protein [Burkholderia sp. Ap-962]
MGKQGTYPLDWRILATGDTLTGVVTGQTADVPIENLKAYTDGQISTSLSEGAAAWADVNGIDSSDGTTVRNTQASAILQRMAYLRGLRVNVCDPAFAGGASRTGGDLVAAFNAAAALLQAHGGGVIEIPYGSFGVSATLDIAEGIDVLVHGATIKALAPVKSLFRITAGLTSLVGGSFDNANGSAQSFLQVDKGWDDKPVLISPGYVGGFTEGVTWLAGDRAIIKGGMYVSNEIHIHSLDNMMNSEISDILMLGGNGVLIEKTTTDGSKGAPEGIGISRLKVLLGQSPATYCINLKAGLEVRIQGNIFDQIVNGQAVILDATAATVNNVKLDCNWMGRNAGASGAQFGVYAIGAVGTPHLSNNTYSGWQEAGIYFNGQAVGTAAYDVLIEDETFYHVDPCTMDINLNYAQRTRISNVTFNGDESLGVGPGVDGRVDLCNWNSKLPPALTLGMKYGLQGSGMVLKSRGKTVIPQTDRLVAVAHGLSYPPDPSQLRAWAIGFANNAPGEIVCQDLGTTGFDIVSRNDPGASGCPVAWTADLTE